jgi:hypothetical protein
MLKVSLALALVLATLAVDAAKLKVLLRDVPFRPHESLADCPRDDR